MYDHKQHFSVGPQNNFKEMKKSPIARDSSGFNSKNQVHNRGGTYQDTSGQIISKSVGKQFTITNEQQSNTNDAPVK